MNDAYCQKQSFDNNNNKEKDKYLTKLFASNSNRFNSKVAAAFAYLNSIYYIDRSNGFSESIGKLTYSNNDDIISFTHLINSPSAALQCK